jgi:hypothetical protein
MIDVPTLLVYRLRTWYCRSTQPVRRMHAALHDARDVEIEGGPHGCSPRTPPTSTASRCRANGRRDATHLPKREQ